MNAKVGSDQVEKFDFAASELKWRQTMLSLHLKNLRRCVSPRGGRSHTYGSPQMRADIAEQLLAEINRDLSRLLRGVNDVRAATKEFVGQVRAGQGPRVLSWE